MAITKTINDVENGGVYDTISVPGIVYDTKPVEGSFNGVTSDAVVKAIDKAKDDMQEKIDEVTLDPSAVALGNVHLLDEVTEFPADGCILIDSETNGPGEMSKDTLLELTAQNAIGSIKNLPTKYKGFMALDDADGTGKMDVDTIFNNFAGKFEDGVTEAKAGKSYLHDGALFVAKENYQGLWDSSKFYPVNNEYLNSIIKDRLNSILGSTKNVFDMGAFFLAGWILDGESASGTVTDLKAKYGDANHSIYAFDGVETKCVIQFKAKLIDSSASTTGNGLRCHITHNDNSATAAAATNTSSDWQTVTVQSTNNSTSPIKSIWFDSASGDGNKWEVKEVQLLLGTRTAEEYEQHLTAVDSVARKTQVETDDKVEEIESDVQQNGYKLKSVTGSTKNVFDMDSFLLANWTLEQDVAKGTVTDLKAKYGDADHSIYAFDGVETKCSIQFKARLIDSSASTTGNGLRCHITHNDNSATAAAATNTSSDWQTVTVQSTNNSNSPIKAIWFDSASGAGNKWEVKDVQLLLGTRNTEDFEQHLTAVDSVARKRVDEIIANSTDKEFGIKINLDGTTERFGDAVGLQNDYVVGSDYANGGHNDFDSIYPWSEIRTCNIKKDSDGFETITYEGESGFRRDGSNGDVFVEIPAFYTKRYRDENGAEIILITKTHKAGFEREPAFYDSVTGKEVEKIYIGAYLTSNDLDALDSYSGSTPACDRSLNAFKAMEGEMYDFVTMQAWQKLLIVEFGIVNLSPILGGFSDMVWSSCKADETVENTNSARFSGAYYINNLFVGARISVADSFGVLQDREVVSITPVEGQPNKKIIEFSGSPVDVTANVTYLYTPGQKSGWTDSLPYHTGRTVLNNGGPIANQFKYRGLEGLWGNLGEKMDGIICKDLCLYWSNKRSDYGDVAKCRRLNYKIPEQNTYTNSPDPKPPQIKRMGWDFVNPTVALPCEAAFKEPTTYYGDLFFTVKDETPEGDPVAAGAEFIGINSMAWDGKCDNGPFTIRFWVQANAGGWLYGSRKIKRSF